MTALPNPHLLHCLCISNRIKEYAKEAALITEEILRQRIKGVKMNRCITLHQHSLN